VQDGKFEPREGRREKDAILAHSFHLEERGILHKVEEGGKMSGRV